MSEENPQRYVEDGRFEYLEVREVGILLGQIQEKVGKCIMCDAPVQHPIDLDHLVDRYTRASSTDGVRVPVNIRGVDLETDVCRVCSDVYFDLACMQLDIPVVSDVGKRLTVTREILEWAIRDREQQLARSHEGNSLSAGGSSPSPIYGSRRSVQYKRERNVTAKARHRDGASTKRVTDNASRRALRALKEKLAELTRLQVEGIPDENVPNICKLTREKIEALRYMPIRTMAARIIDARGGGKASGESKFASPRSLVN